MSRVHRRVSHRIARVAIALLAQGVAFCATACAPASVPSDATRDAVPFDAGAGCGPAFIAFRYATATGPSRDVCVTVSDGVRQDYQSASGCRPAAISATATLASGSRVIIDGYGDPFSSVGHHTFGIAVESGPAGDPELCGIVNGSCRLYSAQCALEVTRAGGRGEIVEAHLVTGCLLRDGMTSEMTARALLQVSELSFRAPLVRGADLSPMAGDAGACP